MLHLDFQTFERNCQCSTRSSEIFELIKGVTILKVLVFMVNIARLWYLIRHFYKH
ncbi:MAG: DUF2127 domain-containing protein [Nostoc sp.]|uniref:DUF2127 domain-containing protein n=1 Tax=Nostoc sp. TaxID=1180 RepID=UPI002FF4E6AA